MSTYEPTIITMRFPAWVRLASAALIVAPIAAGWMVWGGERPAAEWHGIVPYAVLGGWLALTYQVFLVEIYCDDRGMTYVSPLAGVLRIAWSDVAAFSYIRSLDGFAIETSDGCTIWLQQGRLGGEHVAMALQARLPRHARGGE